MWHYEDTTDHVPAQADIHYAPRYVPSDTAYRPRFAHDRDGHRDEALFLAVLERHPDVQSVARASTKEDERYGIDAWVTLASEGVAVPIDVTTRGRGTSGAAEKLLAGLRRGVIPIVVEQAVIDAGLNPDVAYAAFITYREKGDLFLRARRTARGH